MSRMTLCPAAALLLFLVGGCGESPPAPAPPTPAPTQASEDKEKAEEAPAPAPAPTGPVEYRKRAEVDLRRQEPDLFAKPGSVHPQKLAEAFEKRLDAIGKRPAVAASFEAFEAVAAAHLAHFRILESFRDPRMGSYPAQAVRFARAPGLAGKKLFRMLAEEKLDPRLEGRVFRHFLTARKVAHHYLVFADPLMLDLGVKTVKRLAEKAADEETRKLAHEFAVGHRDLFGDDYATPDGFEKKRLEKAGQIEKPTKNITRPENRYTAVFETTKGNIEIVLYHYDAPLTVTNFINLARNGFYDGLNFHRVMVDFMAQGGDPEGTGGGGPGYSFADEFSGRYHRPGTMSMANAGPNTNGSQFFMCYIATTNLNSKHTVFGQIVKGLEVAKSFNKGAGRSGTVADPDKIIRVTVYEETPK